ncbi:hypothetical protein L208DRAFT_1417424, partial [Tricholoma matsutake]
MTVRLVSLRASTSILTPPSEYQDLQNEGHVQGVRVGRGHVVVMVRRKLGEKSQSWGCKL